MSLLGNIGVKGTKNTSRDQMTKDIVKQFKQELKNNDFTILDEWWPDGYLYDGDVSMFHFKLKECPDWCFGLWVSGKYHDENAYLIEVFGQPTHYIDKFKPQASHFLEKDGFNQSNEIYWTDILRMLEYIKKNPYLAWYRDVYGVDYNLEYISPEIAKETFERDETERIEREQVEKIIDQKETEWVENKLKEKGYEFKIIDHFIVVKGNKETGKIIQIFTKDEMAELAKINATNNPYIFEWEKSMPKFYGELAFVRKDLDIHEITQTK